ncbi:MAG: TAXI family TRAP transporter solute-binding subunit [Acidobacteriota bacterium]|nr:TAXI family TRAP transporter solute-binding subunit [Acidobacteriota bacterium]
MHRLRFLAVVTLPVVALVSGILWFQLQRGRGDAVLLASGPKGGTYRPLGEAMGSVLADKLGSIPVSVEKTSGSTENMQLLTDAAGRGKPSVNFAFVQNDSSGKAEVRTVAKLYQEVLQIVVRRDAGISSVEELRGLRVNFGSPTSGARRTMARLLNHLEMSFTDCRASFHGNEAAAVAFENGELDAAVFLAGLKTPMVQRLLEGQRATLLSLGQPGVAGSSLEGVIFALPGMEPAVVPAQTYGSYPQEAVGTVSVDALLVTREDVPHHLVRRVVEQLFANKFALMEKHPAAAEMSEIQGSRGLRFPLHAGAASFYHRNDPPLLVTYAEPLSLALTLVLSLGSGLLALREWARRVKKNRIDVYYIEVDAVAQGLAHESPEEELREVRRKLFGLRKRAFHDLVAERLNADQSFSIFQAFLDTQLFEIDRRLNRIRSG